MHHWLRGMDTPDGYTTLLYGWQYFAKRQAGKQTDMQPCVRLHVCR